MGIYQFDLITWRNTPEGRAGLPRENPVANINAAHWHMKKRGFGAWAVGKSSREASPRKESGCLSASAFRAIPSCSRSCRERQLFPAA